MNKHQSYLLRCLSLAQKGAAHVASNPIVGAVLVYKNIIIGEGYHQQYGAAHAEVNCINSVSNANQHLIEKATLYISLEPCNHFGKTPPCTDLIIKHKIKHVVIGQVDPNPLVSGKGLLHLTTNRVKVEFVNILDFNAKFNLPFLYTQQKQKSFIAAKWAQSNNGFVNESDGKRTLITNAFTQRWVHRFRSEFQAIMVGSNTIEIDNPFLNCRLYNQTYPIIIIVDRYLKLKLEKYNVYNAPHIIIVNTIKEQNDANIQYWKIYDDAAFLQQMANRLFENNIHKILVEGGATLIQHLIKANLINQVYAITNTTMHINNGIAVPEIINFKNTNNFKIENDKISIFENNN